MEERELPRGWAACTVGSVTAPVDKIDPRSDPNREIVYIDISGIDNQLNRIAEAKSFRLKDAPSRARQIVKAGDVLFSTVRPYLRNIAQVRSEFHGEIASTGFSVLRAEQGIEPSFLFLKSISKEFVDALSREQYGVSYPAVKDAQVRAQPLALPPSNEQRRIVEKIETLFARLDKGEEALRDVQKLLARYRQSVLKAAVTGQLTAGWRAENAHRLEPGKDLLARILQTRRETWEGRGKYKEPAAPDTTDLPELPEGWVWTSVDMITRESLIGLVRSAAEQSNVGDGIRYVKMDRVDMNGHLDIETEVRVQASSHEVERYSLRAGDILFNTRNSLELVGKNGIVSKEPHEPTVFNNNLMRIRLVEGTQPEFINYQMCARSFRKVMEKIKRATTSVAAVYGGDLKALPIAIPPVEEQKEICGRLEEKLAQVRTVASWCSTELTRSAVLRQSILKDAFSGRLVPQDPSDEPAAALLARIKETRTAATGTTRRKARA